LSTGGVDRLRLFHGVAGEDERGAGTLGDLDQLFGARRRTGFADDDQIHRLRMRENFVNGGEALDARAVLGEHHADELGRIVIGLDE